MEQHKLRELLDKYLMDDLSPLEKKELAVLSGHPENRLQLELFVEEVMNNPAFATDPGNEWKEKLYDAIGKADHPEEEKVVPMRRNPLLQYAAAVVLIVAGTAVYWLFAKNDREKVQDSAAIVKDANIAPGTNGAILTLADGRKVVLDSAGNGLLATEQGTELLLKEGKLSYHSSTSNTNVTAYNTVSTPNGRQFQLLLPDGSLVWLNAGSSIRFPTSFSSTERVVDISGEVYFEVAKNKEKPFRVNTGNAGSIEVLGTHFNVNAYANEANVKTTLLEGSVKVSTGKQNALLKPGEQAITGQKEGTLKVTTGADMEKIVAWKNGYFNFNETDFKEAMRQLERWYNITVEYDDVVPETRFGGTLNRNLPLPELLHFLEGAGLRFRMEGNRLIVL
ncbi:MAG: FecR family protein [Chitinophagaceae bacterium]